jgi:hypothetical protein
LGCGKAAKKINNLLPDKFFVPAKSAQISALTSFIQEFSVSDILNKDLNQDKCPCTS